MSSYMQSLEQAGFCDVKTMAQMREDMGLPDDIEPDVVGYSFITASKMNWWLSSNCVNCRLNFHCNNQKFKMFIITQIHRLIQPFSG